MACTFEVCWDRISRAVFEHLEFQIVKAYVEGSFHLLGQLVKQCIAIAFGVGVGVAKSVWRPFQGCRLTIIDDDH